MRSMRACLYAYAFCHRREQLQLQQSLQIREYGMGASVLVTVDAEALDEARNQLADVASSDHSSSGGVVQLQQSLLFSAMVGHLTPFAADSTSVPEFASTTSAEFVFVTCLTALLVRNSLCANLSLEDRVCELLVASFVLRTHLPPSARAVLLPQGAVVSEIGKVFMLFLVAIAEPSL